MSEQKPREFYIHVESPADGVRQWAYTEYPQGVGSRDRVIHVIEYSAYQKLAAELDEAKSEIAKLHRSLDGYVKEDGSGMVQRLQRELDELRCLECGHLRCDCTQKFKSELEQAKEKYNHEHVQHCGLQRLHTQLKEENAKLKADLKYWKDKHKIVSDGFEKMDDEATRLEKENLALKAEIEWRTTRMADLSLLAESANELARKLMSSLEKEIAEVRRLGGKALLQSVERLNEARAALASEEGIV
jgi:hypothetical protein